MPSEEYGQESGGIPTSEKVPKQFHPYPTYFSSRKPEIPQKPVTIPLEPIAAEHPSTTAQLGVSVTEPVTLTEQPIKKPRRRRRRNAKKKDQELDRELKEPPKFMGESVKLVAHMDKSDMPYAETREGYAFLKAQKKNGNRLAAQKANRAQLQTEPSFQEAGISSRELNFRGEVTGWFGPSFQERQRDRINQWNRELREISRECTRNLNNRRTAYVGEPVMYQYIWLTRRRTVACPSFVFKSKTRLREVTVPLTSETMVWHSDARTLSQGKILDHCEPREDGHMKYSDSAYLYPVIRCLNPFQYSTLEGYLVLCEVLMAGDRDPLPSNTRGPAEAVWDTSLARSLQVKIGFEQEFMLIDPVTQYPLGWTENNTPAEVDQRTNYCGVGTGIGREFIDAFTSVCLAAGVKLAGVNLECTVGCLEFQLAPMSPLEAADMLFLARFLVITLAEKVGLQVSFAPKPHPDYDGCGLHVNVSVNGYYQPPEKGPKHEVSLVHRSFFILYHSLLDAIRVEKNKQEGGLEIGAHAKAEAEKKIQECLKKHNDEGDWITSEDGFVRLIIVDLPEYKDQLLACSNYMKLGPIYFCMAQLYKYHKQFIDISGPGNAERLAAAKQRSNEEYR